jgi:hypothetical protein
LGLPGTERYRRWEADAPLQAATKRARRALHAEVEAFNDILRAVPTATSAGFRAFALYACELTEAIDGPPIGDALPAYRALAAFAGLPCILLPEEA